MTQKYSGQGNTYTQSQCYIHTHIYIFHFDTQSVDITLPKRDEHHGFNPFTYFLGLLVKGSDDTNMYTHIHSTSYKCVIGKTTGAWEERGGGKGAKGKERVVRKCI